MKTLITTALLIAFSIMNVISKDISVTQCGNEKSSGINVNITKNKKIYLCISTHSSTSSEVRQDSSLFVFSEAAFTVLFKHFST